MNNADQLKQMRRTLQNMNKMVENTIEALNYLIPIIEKTDELLDEFAENARDEQRYQQELDDERASA